MRTSSLGHAARGAAAIVVAGLMLGLVGVSQAQAAPKPKCVAGSPGIGDAYYPTYGNGGYDVRHYGLDIAYDPATDVLEGEAKIRAKATKKLCSFNLDLVGLEVRSVEVNGKRAKWSRDGQELTVTPKRRLGKRANFTTTVRYDGIPVEFSLPGFDVRTGWMTTPEGVTVAGQPEVATAWFPVNDHPRDKAAYSFDVTVPAGYEVVANGVLEGVEPAGDGSTWSWRAPLPMASYLATIDIADWDVNEWETDDGLPVYDAVDTGITGGLREEVDSSLGRQGEVLDLLIEGFGPYPFGTIGAIVPNQDDLFFALENQSRPVYSKLFWLDSEGNPENGDFVVVHELAHQWFGDDVALHNWQDIWLNEGFATYAEWMWEEYEGRATPQEIFQATYDAIPEDDEFWSIQIGDPGVDHLFDEPIYVRGGMTVQALRNEVGDDAFWEIVRTWAAERSGGTGTTDQFIALAEAISGQDLEELFNTWLFTAEKPPPEAVGGAEGSNGSDAEPLSAQAERQAGSWLEDLQRRLRIGRF